MRPDCNWTTKFRSQRTSHTESSATSTMVTGPVGERLQAGTEDAPVLDRPVPLRRLHDSGAGYKYPDLLILTWLYLWRKNGAWHQEIKCCTLSTKHSDSEYLSKAFKISITLHKQAMTSHNYTFELARTYFIFCNVKKVNKFQNPDAHKIRLTAFVCRPNPSKI